MSFSLFSFPPLALSLRDLSRSLLPYFYPLFFEQELSIDISSDYSISPPVWANKRFFSFFVFILFIFCLCFELFFIIFLRSVTSPPRALARRATKSLISIITIRHKWYDNLKRRRVAEWAFLSDLVLLLLLISQNNILFTRRHWIALHSFRLFFHFVCYVIVPLVT